MLNWIISRWYLIFLLSKRDIVGRYKGSIVGIFWSIFTPILMLIIYSFVFTVVFKARWGDAPEIKREYFVVMLYAGIMIHSFVAENLSRSTNLIHANVNYVKKIVFPLQVLPAVMVVSSLFQLIISFFLLILCNYIIVGNFYFTSLYFLLLAIPLIMGLYGVSLIFTVLGVFFRDINQLMSLIITILMFISPIFYPASILPEEFRFYLNINPLTYFIEELRNIVVLGMTLNYKSYFLAIAISLIILILGILFFEKTKKGFADAI